MSTAALITTCAVCFSLACSALAGIYTASANRRLDRKPETWWQRMLP